MSKTAVRQQTPHIVKAWSSDVPEDYAKIVFQQWNALVFFEIDHPFIASCCRLAEQNRVQFMLASDWKARNRESFQISEKTMWVLPADDVAHLTLSAYFPEFDRWIDGLLSRRLLAVDFGSMSGDIVGRYVECIDALTRYRLDWKLAIAPVNAAKAVWRNPKKQPRTNTEPCVYFMQARNTDRIKIGVTTNLKDRLKTIKTSSPFEIELVATIPGGIELERELHRQFAEYRESGEWFRLEGALLQYVERLLQEATHD